MKNNIKLLILLSCFSVYNINTMWDDTPADDEQKAADDEQTTTEQTPADKAAETPAETPAEKAEKEAAAENAVVKIDKVSTEGGVNVDFDFDTVDVYFDTDGTQTSRTNDDTIEIDIDGASYDPEKGTISNESYSYQLSEDALEALGDSPTQEAVDQAIKEVMEANTDDDDPFTQDASEISEKSPNKTSPIKGLLDFFKAIGEGFTKLIDMIKQSFRGTNKPAFDQVESWSEDETDAALQNDASTVQGALKTLNLPENSTIEDFKNVINSDALAKTQIESMLDQTEFAQQIDTATKTLLTTIRTLDGINRLYSDGSQEDDL